MEILENPELWFKKLFFFSTDTGNILENTFKSTKSYDFFNSTSMHLKEKIHIRRTFLFLLGLLSSLAKAASSQ